MSVLRTITAFALVNFVSAAADADADAKTIAEIKKDLKEAVEKYDAEEKSISVSVGSEVLKAFLASETVQGKAAVFEAHLTNRMNALKALPAWRDEVNTLITPATEGAKDAPIDALKADEAKKAQETLMTRAPTAYPLMMHVSPLVDHYQYIETMNAYVSTAEVVYEKDFETALKEAKAIEVDTKQVAAWEKLVDDYVEATKDLDENAKRLLKNVKYSAPHVFKHHWITKEVKDMTAKCAAFDALTAHIPKKADDKTVLETKAAALETAKKDIAEGDKKAVLKVIAEYKKTKEEAFLANTPDKFHLTEPISNSGFTALFFGIIGAAILASIALIIWYSRRH